MATLPSIVADAPLRNAAGDVIPAKELWATQPVLFLVLRRPGCVLCRAESQRICGRKDQYEELGVRLVCLVHEWLPEEIKAFHPAFWPGELYLDETKAFYRAVGKDGRIRKGSVLSFLNPWSRLWQHAKDAKKTVQESNLKGDGLTMGGLMVVSAGSPGELVYSFSEVVFGDHAPEDQVLAACQQAAGSR